MIAEAKLELVHRGASFVSDKFFSIDASPITRINYEEAIQIAGTERNFGELVRLYATAYELAPDRLVSVDAGLELAQQLINCTAYEQARRVLTSLKPLIFFIPLGKQKSLVEARIQEKLAWVEDYEFGYWYSLKHTNETRRIITQAFGGNFSEMDQAAQKVYSTGTHFRGRARFGLAQFGIDSERNIDLALTDFRRAIEYDYIIEDPNQNAKIGFGYAWMSRCHLLVGNLEAAHSNIEWAEGYFVMQQSLAPNDGLRAHASLLKGVYNSRVGNIVGARENFEDAARLWSQKESEYLKGQADAYLGMAASCSWLTNPREKMEYLQKAWSVNKLAVVRGILGS